MENHEKEYFNLTLCLVFVLLNSVDRTFSISTDLMSQLRLTSDELFLSALVKVRKLG